ncbi:hypothetical protein E9993_06230 [Labilibacter sediminis]|nr:hypothetical protein E9993_06230 [Labilibacter sediminis]
MKNLIPLFTMLLFGLVMCSSLKAQDYKNMVAFRTGVSNGFMYKRLLPNETAFAGQLTFRDQGVTISGQRLFHQLAFPDKSYKWFLYYGYGAHFRYYTRYFHSNPFKPFRPQQKYEGNYFALGFGGMVGLEFRFLKYPFVISSDISPNFEFGGAYSFKVNLDMVSINLAYTF